MLSVLISTSVCHGQGVKVVYSEQMKITTQVEKLDPSIRALVETQLKQQDKTMCLLHHQEESLYSADSETSSTPDMQSNARIARMGGGGAVYKNQKEELRISQELILDKKFLITEPLASSKWKVEKDEKIIAGYACKKAVDSTGIIAWYCPEIPISNGPGIYGGLPGLILELETPVKTFVAQTVNLNYDTANRIKQPNSGKKVTRAAYNQIRDEKMKDMGVQNDGPGVKIIKM